MTDLTYADLDADRLWEGEWDALVRRGMRAAEQYGRAQWEIGSIALQLTTKWSHNGALGLFAKLIGVSEVSLRQYRRVAELFPDDPTDPGKENTVSFSIARAASTTDEPGAWVNKAEEFGWSTDTLVSKIRADRAEREAAKPAQTPQEPADEPEPSEPGPDRKSVV